MKTYEDAIRAIEIISYTSNANLKGRAAHSAALDTLRSFIKQKPYPEGTYYRLGGQMDDVVSAEVMRDAYPVYWCSIEQVWRV